MCCVYASAATVAVSVSAFYFLFIFDTSFSVGQSIFASQQHHQNVFD